MTDEIKKRKRSPNNFADIPVERLKEISAKGGRGRIRKTGFALYDKDELKEMSRQAARKRWDKRKEKAKNE